MILGDGILIKLSNNVRVSSNKYLPRQSIMPYIVPSSILRIVRVLQSPLQ